MERAALLARRRNLAPWRQGRLLKNRAAPASLSRTGCAPDLKLAEGACGPVDVVRQLGVGRCTRGKPRPGMADLMSEDRLQSNEDDDVSDDTGSESSEDASEGSEEEEEVRARAGRAPAAAGGPERAIGGLRA